MIQQSYTIPIPAFPLKGKESCSTANSRCMHIRLSSFLEGTRVTPTPGSREGIVVMLGTEDAEATEPLV
jgi:hypothetical protein